MKLRINVCKYEELYEGELDKAPKEISNMQVVYINLPKALYSVLNVAQATPPQLFNRAQALIWQSACATFSTLRKGGAYMYKIVQGNGSITIPAKIRASLGISHRDAMEINVQKNGDILLSKCEPSCVFCKGTENVAIRKGVRMCLNCWWKVMGKEETTDGTEGDEQQAAGDGADQEG